MNFTFETLPINNKGFLRLKILMLFDRDIAMAPCMFSSRNYAFIFDQGSYPAIIRVGIEMPHHKVGDVLSELLWVDDLKSEIPNICQAIPSLENRLVERISADGEAFLVTMFRKSNGAALADNQWNAAHFYSAGALLGKIHRNSSEGYQIGFRYKRKHWDEDPLYDFTCFDDYFAPSARRDAEVVLQKIKKIPRNPRWYGMIHGDFQNANLLCDWGDLWAFDFDDCCYGYFMFDIACIAHICVHSLTYAAAHPTWTARERLLGEEGILTQLRAGYSSEYQLPEEQWDLFHDFFRLRVARIMSSYIFNNLYPRDLFTAFFEPVCAHFKYDQLPVDRIEEVQKASRENLTPQQMRVLAGHVKKAMG